MGDGIFPDLLEVMAPRTDHKDLDVENNNTNDIEAENGDNFQEDDAEAAELARLRCESVTTEEKRQQGEMNIPRGFGFGIQLQKGSSELIS